MEVGNTTHDSTVDSMCLSAYREHCAFGRLSVADGVASILSIVPSKDEELNLHGCRFSQNK